MGVELDHNADGKQAAVAYEKKCIGQQSSQKVDLCTLFRTPRKAEEGRVVQALGGCSRRGRGEAEWEQQVAVRLAEGFLIVWDCYLPPSWWCCWMACVDVERVEVSACWLEILQNSSSWHSASKRTHESCS